MPRYLIALCLIFGVVAAGSLAGIAFMVWQNGQRQAAAEQREIEAARIAAERQAAADERQRIEDEKIAAAEEKKQKEAARIADLNRRANAAEAKINEVTKKQLMEWGLTESEARAAIYSKPDPVEVRVVK